MKFVELSSEEFNKVSNNFLGSNFINVMNGLN